jgi:excisionase family DNA binding protein
MASGNSSASSRFWKVGRVAAYLGVSPSQVRLLVESGELTAIVSAGGHRLVAVESVLAYEGFDSLDDGNPKDSIPVALVARVSTGKQSKGFGKGESSDLSRQRDRLRDYINGKWGEKAKVKEFCRTSSGMNYACPIFLSLVHAILNGEFRGGFVVCSHSDRVLRFGVTLFEEIVSFGGAELVCIGETESDKSQEQSLADDVLSVICHFTAVKYGARAAETCTKSLTPEAVKRIVELKAQNLDISAIVRAIEQEGYLDNRGSTPSYFLVRKYIRQAHDLGKATGVSITETGYDLFNQFIAACTRKDEKGRVRNTVLRKAYAHYCEKLGKAPESSMTVGAYLNKMGYRKSKSNGARVTIGLALVD